MKKKNLAPVGSDRGIRKMGIDIRVLQGDATAMKNFNNQEDPGRPALEEEVSPTWRPDSLMGNEIAICLYFFSELFKVWYRWARGRWQTAFP